MAHRGRDDRAPLPARAPPRGESARGVFDEGPEPREGGLDTGDQRSVAQHVREHRLGALVVGVELVEAVGEPLLGVGDRAPRVGIRPRVAVEVVRRAGGEEVVLGREVAVDRVPLHSCPLGDRADRGSRRADAAVQLDRGLGDPLPRVGHRLGAPAQLVLPLGLVCFRTHRCATIMTDRSAERSLPAFYSLTATYYERKIAMLTASTPELDLIEVWIDSDPRARRVSA